VHKDKYLTDETFSEVIACDYISSSIGWNCTEKHGFEIQLETGFPQIMSLKKSHQKVVEEEHFHLDLGSKEKIQMVKMNSNVKWQQELCEQSSSIKTWFKNLNHNPESFSSLISFKNTSNWSGNIEVDLPEVAPHPKMYPTHVKIMAGQDMLDEEVPVQYDPESGKAKINIKFDPNVLQYPVQYLPLTLTFSTMTFSTFQPKIISTVVEARLCPNFGTLCGMIKKFGILLRNSDPHCGHRFEENLLSYVSYIHPETGKSAGPVFRKLVGDTFLYYDASPKG
jgi:hypothetical protein